MWKSVPKNKKSNRRTFLASSSRNSLYLPNKDDITIDDNILKCFISDEKDYQCILKELSELFGSIPAKRPGDISNPNAISANVIVCLSSSLAMMHTLSKDIAILLIKIESKYSSSNYSLNYVLESKNENNTDKNELIQLCENIVELLTVYEVFCNNENGICNNDLLKLYSKDPEKKTLYSLSIGKIHERNTRPYSELILYPFLAVDRYESILREIGRIIPEIIPSADLVKELQELLVESKNNVIKSINFVTKLNQIKDLPANKQWLIPQRECLKVSPVKKHRSIRPNDKERIFFLCNDILIYCTSNYVYRGYFPCKNLILKNLIDNPTQFQLTYIKRESRLLLSSSSEDKIRYTITADSKVEKQDWLQKFHIALCSANGRVEQSPRLNRRLRLSTLEETTLNENTNTISFTSSPLSRELKDLSECLNSTTVWNSNTKHPLLVSINLLEQVIAIYNENRGLLERFGQSGFGLISIHTSFLDFETASAELQYVNLKQLKEHDKFPFWVNIYNTLSLHSLIKQTCNMKNGIVAFQNNNKYYIGGNIYSLSYIEHYMLRVNSTPSSSISSKVFPKFKKNDPRTEFALAKHNLLVNFALNIGSVNSPPIVVLQSQTWKDQMLLQANMYCRANIRIFLHTNQRKIHLPKIFNLYLKDFGNTQRDMLLYIRDQYLHPSQQQELAFLDDISASITIKYDNPDWEFKFPLGKSQEQHISGGLHKEYVLLINQKHIYVRDSLVESNYTFIVPHQLLNIWYPKRRSQLREFGKTMGKSPLLVHCYDKQVQHLDMITRANNTYSQYVTTSGDYHGLSFRPSTYKKDSIFQFVALNLQTQYTVISSDKDFTSHVATYSHVTFGAPAAHYYRFKNGIGLRQLIEYHTKLVENISEESPMESQKDIIDTEAFIQMRLDVCIPQIVSAVVTIFAQHMSLRPDNTFFTQILRCGLLVQFESLLSTHGSEMGMIGDMDIAVRLLEHFKIRIIEKDKDKFNPNICILHEKITNGRKSLNLPASVDNYIIEWQVDYFNELPELIKEGTLISIKPILFTQGINEKQTVAIRLGETKLQEKINLENFTLLSDYYEIWRDYTKNTCDDNNNYKYQIETTEEMLNKLGRIIETSKCEKNVRILSLSADLCRSLGGLRCTSCKSAKDRTSMSITWEQGRFLHKYASLPKASILKVANDMRSRGVRRENAFRNIGKQKFKFNSFQKSSLPKPYQFRKNE